MSSEVEQYSGHDGTIMLLRIWKPEGRPRAVIIGFHGLGSHSGLQEQYAKIFVAKGFIFYAPDLRGFGTFPGRKGHVDRYDEYDEDIKLLVEQVKEGHPDEKLFLFGHSLGAVHAVRYVMKYPNAPVDGIIGPCPAVSERLKVSAATRAMGAAMSKLNVKMYIDNGLDFDLLAKNKEVVELNRNDPLRFDKATPRYAIEGLAAAQDTNDNAFRIKLPIFIPQAGDDQIVVPEKNKEFFDRIGSEDKTWKLYPGLWHQPFEDEDGGEFIADIVAWIEERL
ncbi:alpha/beta hydrolase [Candidatus Thorarchaeota archaeon]|nr:MAG: alpha/beta hydrolase [Candidatus Thorarchaeota archaeon]